MTKKMLIDAAHPEEVRVAVLDNDKVEDFDFESASRKPLRGNIYLARVTRVEPSLQAAFVEYGGNRHGFLAFSEIHPDYYQIPVSDRQALQAAEAEVAELASQLELSSRGDDDHDHDDEHDHDHDEEERERPRKARRRRGADSDDREDDDESAPKQAGAGDDASGDPTDEIAGDAASDEEEEEEQDGEENDDDGAVSLKVKPAEEEDSASDDDTAAEDVEAAADDASDEASEDDAETDETVEARAADDADDDSADDEDDGEDDADTEEENETPETKRAKAKEREALFERYKEAKRKRSHLLRNYKIQEVIKRRQILLVQVVKEERGNKGAALTTYMSLAGRYCVLMPNTARGGGISRKIPHSADRKRLRRVVDSLDVPQGMGLIIRTAGAKRTKTEVKRDYDYLLRLWETIRSLTLKSIAPCLIYEEASLIKRAIRDLYDKDIGEVLVEGENGYREAKDFMKMLMPSHAKHVQPYKGNAPIFLKFGVESQLDGMYQPTVRLKSGGYIVIHQTEALVAIDVNSGRATRERNIEQTALKTNIEAAYEAARQFRMRDLAGLIVLDFIDMEEQRNNRKVEKALKDAIKHDRARIQLGRISNFGLLEMSRQRRRSGIVDGTTQACPTCAGAGAIRSAEMAALRILRAMEGEAAGGKAGLLTVHAPTEVAVYVLNHHREWLKRVEDQNGVSIELIPDPERAGDDFSIEKAGVPRERKETGQVIRADQADFDATDDVPEAEAETETAQAEGEGQDGERKKRRRRRRRKDKDQDRDQLDARETDDNDDESDSDGDSDKDDSGKSDDRAEAKAEGGDEDEDGQPKRRRRRGRRGGRRNRRNRGDGADANDGENDVAAQQNDDAAENDAPDANNDGAQEVAVMEAVEVAVEEVPEDAASAEPQPAPEESSLETAEQPHAANGHDAAADTAEPAEEPAAAKTDDEAGTDLAEAPQAKDDKPRKKGWWSRA